MKRELNRIATNEGFYLGLTNYSKTSIVDGEDLVVLNNETNLLVSLPPTTMVTPDMKQFIMESF